MSEKFHHYEILRKDDGTLFELGRGAMGVTYKAFDTRLHCYVALKVIEAAYVQSMPQLARQRFLCEARAAARLRHPNVASVLYLGDDAESYFYAMELIEGETLAMLVEDRGPLDVTLMLRIALQVGNALNAAHKVGIVHRDLKPSNLMLVEQDEELLVKVIDFGIAKSINPEMEATLTGDGLLGTPLYASPEQLLGRETDTRSDVYSLGVTLWYLLTGKTPFIGSLAQLIRQQIEAPPPLDQLAGQSPEIISLLERMLQKDPADRPQSPAELRAELKHCLLRLPPASRRDTLPPRPVAELKPRRTPLLVSLAIVSLMAAGLALYLPRPALQRPPTLTPAPALPTPFPTPSPVAPLPQSPVTPITPTSESVPTDAIVSLEMAAKRGEADAVLALVELYWARNQPGDAEKAVAILKRSDDPRALHRLGRCYGDGRGIERNVEQAFNLFDRAARLGDLNAKHDLAVMIMNPPSGEEANPRYAASLLKEGAEAGNVNCMHSYARCLWEGAGVRKDHDEAVKWFRKAAAQGHQSATQWLKEHPSARDTVVP